MNPNAYEYVSENYGSSVSMADYAKISEWMEWWQGKRSGFHDYLENGVGGRPQKRELYRMNMAKKVCEDWASILFNDRTYITCSDEKAQEILCGKNGTLDGDFIMNVNRLTELTFALGTGACIIRPESYSFPNKGRITFDFVPASAIIPISVSGDRINECAFVSEIRRRGKHVTEIEIHTLESDGYVIKRCELTGDENSMDRDVRVIDEIHTMSDTRLFAILRPNIINHIDMYSGLGISVFADAVDCLKGVDLAFNNFARDIKLGGKKVFINQSLIMRDDRGNIYTPDDVAQQLFVTIGDGDISENTMITEHNPDLRSEENALAVQNQLDYLSFRCGLGTRHYMFSNVQGHAQLTATQYMGERQDMRQNAAKHSITCAEFIKDVARAVLWIEKNVYGIEFGCDIKNIDIDVRFDDSYFTDTMSEKNMDITLVDKGIMSADEFRKKWM